MSEQDEIKKILLEKEREIIRLKNEISKYQKKLELAKELVSNYDFFDKCYNPIRHEYKYVHQHLCYFFEVIQKLKNIYNQRLLLSPNYSNVKIREEQKTLIINETRIVLSKCQIDKIPPLKDFYINKPEGAFLAGYERTKPRSYLIKKRQKITTN